MGGLAVELREGTQTVQVLAMEHDDMPPYNFSFVPPLSAYKRPNRSAPRCEASFSSSCGSSSVRTTVAVDGPKLNHSCDVHRCHALGDLTIRVRPESNATGFATYSSANAGASVRVKTLPAQGAVLAAADITDALNASPPQPHPLNLRVVRHATLEAFLPQHSPPMASHALPPPPERRERMTQRGAGAT